MARQGDGGGTEKNKIIINIVFLGMGDEDCAKIKLINKEILFLLELEIHIIHQ